MFKLTETNYQTMVVHNGASINVESGRRFIIPVASTDADLTAVMRRVWELANPLGARVLLLGLCEETMHEPALRRALATMSAIMSYGKVSAQSEIIFGRNWVNAVRSRLQPGDTVVYWHEQGTGLIHAKLDVPVCLLSDISSQKVTRSSWLRRAAVWLGSIAIMVGFFFIQAQVGHFANGWATALQLLSLAGEFGSILFWNSLLA
jgi:hypothetical protein